MAKKEDNNNFYKEDFTVFGHVNDEGKLSIYGKDAMQNQIANQYKNTAIQMTFGERFYGLSHPWRSYYFAVIVPERKKALYSVGVFKSLDDTDLELRNLYLFYEVFNSEKGKYSKRLHTLAADDTKVTSKMMKHFCELCIVDTIENLDWAIPYPSEHFTHHKMTKKQKESILV